MSQKETGLWWAAFLICSAIAASAQEKPPRRSVTEKLIVHITERIKDLTFSKNRRRVAYIAQASDNKIVAVIDGQREKAYDAIVEMAFSPDSQRVAYMASERDKWFVVIDGQEQKRYDGIGKNTLVFSPDSKRIAYQAQLDDKRFVVLDGKEENAYDSILPPPVFSPDSKHLFYLALSESLLTVSLVIDGQEQKPYGLDPRFGNTLTLSPDGRRFAYAAIENNKILVVVDGQKQKLCDDCTALTSPWALDNTDNPEKWKDTLTFSSDNRLAYVAGRGSKEVVVIDGKEEKEWDATFGPLLFSPDGKHLAYEAADSKKGRRFIVVDGKAQRPYIGTGRGSLVFSPDSNRLAYNGRDEKKWFLVADGKEGQKYDGVGNPIFSADSKRTAYKATMNHKAFVVVDGKEEKKYDAVPLDPVFAPDSKRVAYAAKEGHMYSMVVDGEEGKPYDYVFAPSFDAPDSLHYLVANKGPKGSTVYYLVEERLN